MAEQYGHPIVARFSDAGISRSVQERPGLMEMFACIGKHPEVGFIIVNELERLTAGIAQRAEVIDSAGRVVRSGELELHPDEYPWLVRIFEWADADVSTEEIARRLTNEGVPTKSGNAHWRGNTICGILDNPFYKGEMVWGKQAIRRFSNGKTYLELREESDPGRITKPNPLGAIVDPVVWDRIAARRAAKRGARNGYRGTFGVHVLDGFVYCAKCGNKCYPQRNNSTPLKDGTAPTPRWRYVCSGSRTNFERQPGFAEACQKANSMAEVKIIEALGSYRTNPAVVTVRPTRRVSADVDQARARLEAVIAQANTERVNAQRLAIAGKISDEMLDETLAETEVRLAAAQQRLEALDVTEVYPEEAYVVESLDAMADLAGLLLDDQIPVEDRRTALRHIGIERIYIERPKIGVEFALDAVE